jgi:gliding motility-associated protein GldL
MAFSIAELTQTEGWKGFMAKLYGWGASVVIIGALFKIMHWPGAAIMLTCGLMTEAVIFFFSAFEPIHREIDWSLVYPELSGLDDEGEMDVYKENIVTGRGDVSLEKFEDIIKIPTTTINSEAIVQINEGIENLHKTAKDISQITDVATATKSFAKNFNTAAQSLDSFANVYAENSDVLKNSATVLSSSFQKNAELVAKAGTDITNQVTNSGQSLADTYTKMTDNISKAGVDIVSQVQKSGATLSGSYEKLAQSVTTYYTSIDQHSQTYTGNLGKLGKSLSDLNSLYEMQMKETTDHIKSAEKAYKDFDNIIGNLQQSVEQTNRYRSELAKLSDSLASLNSIYGNMLSSMNIVKK